MKTKYIASAASFLLASVSLTQGAAFFDDFSSLVQNPTPSTQGQNLNGYNGWVSGSGVGSLPLGYGYTIGSPSSAAAAMGVAFDIPAGNSFSVYKDLSTGLAGAQLLTTFVIVDSDPLYPARNNYSIEISSGATTLFSMNLDAVNQDAPTGSGAQWYATVPGATPSLFVIAQENGLYNLTVNFVKNLGDVDYFVNLVPAAGGTAFTTSGTIAGGDGKLIDRYSISSSIGSGSGWGSGYIGFDNVAVPETSSVTLLGLAALGLLRRRRN